MSYNPHNYMNPNPELRKYNGEYYMYTPTKTQDYDWGSVGIGGTVEKIANPLVAGYNQNQLNNVVNATIDPTTWVNNAKYTQDEIKSNVQKTFSGFDPDNSTGWQSQLDTLTKQATDLYNQDPTRQDKVFGDILNTFRYNPANNKGVQTIQAANNPTRPEFTSQEQAGVYGQTGQLTSQDQRNQMVKYNVDPQTFINFNKSNPNIQANWQDFAIMGGANPTSVPGVTTEDARKTTTQLNMETGLLEKVPSSGSQTLNKAPSGGVSYTVKAGDTLSQIARKFNTSIESIMAANPSIKNPNLIYSNQTIQVPGVNSGVDKQEFLNSIQNKITEDLKKFTGTKTIFKTDGEDSFNKSTKDSESVTEFKMPTSSSDLYNKLLNTEEIKGMKNKLTEYQKELDTLDAEELAMEGDIRKQIEGEAPNSVIRAMVAEKVRALYPKRLAIQAEAKAVQSQLEQALENAKQQFTLKLQDQENALKYLDTLIAGGTKLTAEQYKIADDALGYGAGFAKSYYLSKAKETDLDELKTLETITSLQSKLPSTQSFAFNGETYYGTKDNVDKTQFITAGGKVWKVTLDNNGKIVSKESLGDSAGSEVSPPNSYKEWELAGGVSGTGKTYAEFLKSSGLTTPKQYQYTAANFATRLDAAGDIVSSLESKFTGAESYAGKFLPNILKSADRQQLEQAEKNFLNAVLRRESGAVISDTEFANGAAQYFPQPGDTNEVLQQKKANREMVTKNIINEAGPAISEVAPQLLSKYGLGVDSTQQGNFKYSSVEDFAKRATPQEKGEFNSLKSVPELKGKSPQELFEFYKEEKGFSEPLSVGNSSAQKIAAAIKQVESGGNYQIKGSSGENGAYQFMPSTWKAWAGQYLGNANAPMTVANQDKVAIAKITDLLNQGYDAREIALIWNGGQPIVKKGVNKYGVAYDSGAYAKKVLNQLS
jgi:LysM repeat protein